MLPKLWKKIAPISNVSVNMKPPGIGEAEIVARPASPLSDTQLTEPWSILGLNVLPITKTGRGNAQEGDTPSFCKQVERCIDIPVPTMGT
jgi:hypothetical protein